ncbi:MAG: response regulator transcription factor [Tannerellaceae bacterium]|jgi:DNA-binding NarL/FixJ family response regulator|nr:response regulator transcription factor [Tannerellaceae bacterium]
MINVQIVDEHQLLTEGLGHIIHNSGVARVSAVYYDLESCRKGLQSSLPDVLLLDIGLPDGNGVDFCAEVKALYPELKVMMMTAYDDYSIVKRSLSNGALGYVVKYTPGEELVAGIRTVAGGEIFLCRKIEALMRKKEKEMEQEDVISLGNKEKEVLLLIGEGYTNARIASAMCVSKDTIKGYRRDLLRKFNVNKSILAFNIARTRKLI